MQIHLSSGIGDIKFGMTEPELRGLIGPPDRLYKNEDNPVEVIYQYNRLLLRATFYTDEGDRLGYLRCANPALHFQGAPIIGRALEEVKTLFDIPKNEWVRDEYMLFDSDSSSKDKEFFLVLVSDYKLVTQIELGIPFWDENRYFW